MLRHQLNSLMVVRRAMGDIGASVVLRSNDFLDLYQDTSIGEQKSSREDAARGMLVLNTCNGPTEIRNAALAEDLAAFEEKRRSARAEAEIARLRALLKQCSVSLGGVPDPGRAELALIEELKEFA